MFSWNTWNNTKHVDAENEINDHIASHTKLTNDLTREVKLILMKRLTKYLIDKYSALNS